MAYSDRPAPPPLTEEQKQIILANYATMELGTLVPLVYPGAPADGRSLEGREIRAFLAGMSLTVRTSEKIPVEKVTLTDDQRALIEKMHPTIENTLELARLVFNRQDIKQLSHEWRVVYAYRKEIFPDAIKTTEEPVQEMHYKPPATLQALVGVVNQWVSEGGKGGGKTYKWGQLKASEERELNALMSYVRVYSFAYTASQYEKQVDRDLFVSQFIRWAHDKPDLTQIEVDQMIMAAAERVNIAQIDRTIHRIDKMQDEIVRGEDVDENGKVRKLGMTDVELINAVRTKSESAKKHLSKLMADLEEVRSKRLDATRSRYTSIVDILDAFRTDEGSRNSMFIDAGIAEKDDDKDEVVRLSGVDELMALISGQSKEEGGA